MVPCDSPPGPAALRWTICWAHAVMRLPGRASLIAVLLGIAGCATVGRPPPTGPMWAFFTDADTMLGPRAVIYTTSPVACETERRRRIGSSTACVRVVVSAGTGYYAVEVPSQFNASLADGGIGTIDRDRCERLRANLFRAYSGMGDCQAVAVQRVP
jgi:hypothetical protein